MTYKQKQIDQLCSAIARMRSGNQCEIANCKNRDPECHHILFGANKLKGLIYPDMRAMLCSFHHQMADFAPHVSNDNFLARYLTEMEDSLRALRIVQVLKKPFDKKHTDYKAIHKELVEQYKLMEKTSFMDQF